jgi:hypothetical protein
MPTPAELKANFRAYFDDIDKCVKGRCFWALLHLLIVLPDVCSAMETMEGQADDGRYRSWCKRFLADELIKPNDWYRIRCLILHQGRTNDEERKSRYINFRFSHSQVDGPKIHRQVEGVPGGLVLHLDVRELATEVRKAIENWFNWIEKEATKEIAENVRRNAASLAQKSVIVASATQSQSFTLSITSSPPIR